MLQTVQQVVQQQLSNFRTAHHGLDGRESRGQPLMIRL
jgi:hypothetical protein